MVKLTDKQRAELEALEAMPDDEIDLSDIPERPIDWSKAKIGVFYQPAWKEFTLLLDENIIDWFEENTQDPEKVHERINNALREHMRRERFPNWGKEPTGEKHSP